MKELDLPAVVRVHTERGSHIEPDIQPTWSDAEKLAWLAASVAHDAGLRIRIYDEAYTLNDRPVPGYYSISVGGHGISAYTFREAWVFLHGFDTGVEVGRGTVTAKETS